MRRTPSKATPTSEKNDHDNKLPNSNGLTATFPEREDVDMIHLA